MVGVDSTQVDNWNALRYVNLTPTRSLKREEEVGFMNLGFYWDDTVIFKIEEKCAAARKPLHTRVFIAAGGAEPPQTIELTQRFVSVVNSRKYEGPSLESHVFEEETHMSSEAPIAARGLRMVCRASPSK